ncbi:PTS ascorbate transporter subunit IIB [Vallitalea pronyensis]|uniref:PTS ascorbate transporter subunit IIB n=1 Tax=Vallitalea pronyensis TaxID=1348613 RepID=A0A8J8MIM9_9FIRM|nr:PTS ascorbate transporter subunit IIB [Vallitalea pronyensis]QUI22532.1 PTS ascorbate transporter subunit IIB [Vallitalea pronyensis]
MLRLLAICGNGMGTSTIIKIKVKGICKKLGIDLAVESCSAGEAAGFIGNTDIILTTPEWGKMVKCPDGVALITLVNLMDEALLTEKLVEAVKEHFPNEMQ